MPSGVSTLGSPIPESWRIVGVPIVPAERTTSFFAVTHEMADAEGTVMQV